MNLTVKKFFDSVYAYNYKIAALYTGPQEKKSIIDGILVVQKIEQQVKELANTKDKRKKYDMVCEIMSTGVNPYLFIKPGSNDNRVYWVFIEALRNIVESYRDDVNNPDVLKESLKKCRAKL